MWLKWVWSTSCWNKISPSSYSMPSVFRYARNCNLSRKIFAVVVISAKNKDPITRSYCCIRVHRPITSKVLPPSEKWIRVANPVTAAWARAVSGQSPRLLLLSKIEVDFVSTWKWSVKRVISCGFHTGRQPISFKNYYSYSDVATWKNLEWWLLMYWWMSTFCFNTDSLLVVPSEKEHQL